VRTQIIRQIVTNSTEEKMKITKLLEYQYETYSMSLCEYCPVVIRQNYPVLILQGTGKKGCFIHLIVTSSDQEELAHGYLVKQMVGFMNGY